MKPMVRRKGKSIAIAAISLTLMTALVFSYTVAFFQKGEDRNGPYGTVSLRSYYDSGDGTKTNPFIITRPRHLYNFSRLQNLGIYGDPDKKTYFQLGKKGLNGPEGYGVYASDDSSDTQTFLDMGDSDFSFEPIWAIGTETMPFYGEFDGKGLTIKDLTVFSDPQDAGFFGYTAHGSYVHDFFLDNVSIHTLGYTDQYKGLYGTGDDYTAADGVYISYLSESGTTVPFTAGCEEVDYIDYDAGDFFAGEAESLAGYEPVITVGGSNPLYEYKLLGSGNFLAKTGPKQFKVDIEAVGDWFKSHKEDEENPPDYPLTFSSSLSLCATKTDEDGIDHSRVVANLQVAFTLQRETDEFIHMVVASGDEHSNNIGLIVGHCDGSLKDCYVHNGEFYLNDGDRLHKTSSTYNPLDYHSHSGLIGLVGDTVHNAAAEESGAASVSDIDIGAVDFTTIYDSIITTSSFNSSAPVEGNPNLGYTYAPNPASEYEQYLRQNNSRNYVTEQANVVSFRGRQVIRSDDLGVFTIATDYNTDGYGGNASTNLSNSSIKSEDVTYNGEDYYIYATTGEYVRGKNNASQDIYNCSYDDYLRSLIGDYPTRIYPGYHFPHAGEISSASFRERELYQNYVVRFKLEADYRSQAKTFYMSESDRTKPGGDFMAKYFHYKLVDDEGDAVPEGGENCGVMLRDYRFGKPREISKFSASFATQDLSLLGAKIYSLYDASQNLPEVEDPFHPAANTVNFEITKDWANVTVVAGLTDPSKPAALGVYRYNYEPDNPTAHTYSGAYNNPEPSPYSGDGRPIYITKNYKDPDYAFFMPSDERLAYFDYVRGALRTNDNGTPADATDDFEEVLTPEAAELAGISAADIKGYYGNYIYEGGGHRFVPADEGSDATLPSLTEYGHESGKTRLYTHTFKLPAGHYCLMSATGTNTKIDDVTPFGTAKIFYVCAQGQDNGQFSLRNTAFDGVAQKIDFVTQIPGDDIIADPSTWRCYISLLKEESKRSHFLAAPLSARIRFDYLTSDGGYFAITSPNDATSVVDYMVVDTYRHDQFSELFSIPVSLFGGESSTGRPLYYPTP